MFFRRGLLGMLFIDLGRGRMVGRGWRSFRGVYRGKEVILERD